MDKYIEESLERLDRGIEELKDELDHYEGLFHSRINSINNSLSDEVSKLHQKIYKESKKNRRGFGALAIVNILMIIVFFFLAK